MSDDPVEITVTVKVPPTLVLEMQKAALAASIEGGVRAQQGMFQVWTDMWLKAGEQAQRSLLDMVSGSTKTSLLPHHKK